MKKLAAIILLVAMVLLCFAGCKDDKADTSGKADTASKTEKVQSDLEYVKNKGTLTVGVTDFAPMDYLDDNNNWIGFDADMAKEFAKSLGVNVEFIEIEWDNKTLELDGKSIDCVWNGMTLDDEVKAAMATSKPYCNNAQVIVVPAKDAEKYATADSCKKLAFAVEVSSAGMKMAAANEFEYTEVADQATALMEVAAGSADAAIIDSLMAAAMVGEGTGYAQLAYTASLNSEEYGVGFRKGSDLVDEINKFFDETKANGKLDEIAKLYGVQAALIK